MCQAAWFFKAKWHGADLTMDENWEGIADDKLRPEGCGPIGRCAGCGLHLPLRLPGFGEIATNWVCVDCGARYSAVLDEAQCRTPFQNVRPANLSFDRSCLAQPPAAIDAFIRGIMREECPKRGERRRSERRKLGICVAAVAVDETLVPIGEPFLAATYDISTGGLSMVHTRAITAKLVVVEFPNPPGPTTSANGATMQMLLRVVRCRALGRFYEIAGAFVTRMAP